MVTYLQWVSVLDLNVGPFGWRYALSRETCKGELTGAPNCSLNSVKVACFIYKKEKCMEKNVYVLRQTDNKNTYIMLYGSLPFGRDGFGEDEWGV